MSSTDSNKYCFLDGIRLSRGNTELKNTFYRLSVHDSNKAFDSINDDNLSFRSLFVLKSVISDSNLYKYLNRRNNNALNIINTILNRKKHIGSRPAGSPKNLPQAELKWILDTGYPDEGLGFEYDEVLEFAAILLIKLHKDNSRLKITTDMIFDKNRNDIFPYNLIWALFESGDPHCLLMIADYLRSDDPKDVCLAQKLLNFIPGMRSYRDAGGNEQYSYFLKWFTDNQPFLYYTGETFQQSGEPVPYAVRPDSQRHGMLSGGVS